MAMSVATSPGSTERLAISQQMSSRRRPTALYVALSLLAAFTFAYEVRLCYQRFPAWFGNHTAAERPFFVDTDGTSPLEVSFVVPAARQAGIKNGDALVSINGRPIRGTADFGEAMAAAREGDVLRVTVRSKGDAADRSASIKLSRRMPGHNGAVWWTLLILNVIIVPMLCLGLGFWVAFIRPRDPLAWLLLGFLTTFAVFFNADAEQWGPIVRDLATIYRMGVEAALPISLMLFGVYFPQPFPRTGRWRWWYRAAWVLLVPMLLNVVLVLIDQVGTMENRASVIGSTASSSRSNRSSLRSVSLATGCFSPRL